MYFLQIQTAKIYSKISHVKPGYNPWVNGPLLNIFLMFPSIVADLFMGIIIYKISFKKTSYKKALVITFLFLLNPVVLYNSAFWGQMDALNNVLFLLSIFLIYEKKYFFSFLFLTLSLFTKISLLVLLPIYLFIFLIEQKNFIKFALYALLNLVMVYFLTLPISTMPITWFTHYFANSSGGIIPQITSFAFNFWWFLFRPIISFNKPSNLFLFSSVKLFHSPTSDMIYYGLSLETWGFILFGIFLIPFIYYLFSKKASHISIQKIFLLLAMTALLAFNFLPRMHERYLYPFFVLFPVIIAWYPKSAWYYFGLSILNWINLYLVWHPMELFFLPYSLMSNLWFQWEISALIVLISLILYIYSLKILYAEK